MNALLKPTPQYHFGSRPFTDLPEVVFDTEIARNIVLSGHMWPDGTRLIIRTPHDAPLGEPTRAQLDELHRNHVSYGWNAEFDLIIDSALVAGFDPTKIHEIAQALIVKRPGEKYAESPWSVRKRFGVPNRPDWLVIDLMGAAGKRLALKSVGMALGAPVLIDLPFDPEARLEGDALEITLQHYLPNDLALTAQARAAPAVESGLAARRKLSDEYGIDLMSAHDAQVAEQMVAHHYHAATGIDMREMKDACARSLGAPFRLKLPAYDGLDVPPALAQWRAGVEGGDFTYPPGVNTPIAPAGAEALIQIAELTVQLAKGGVHSTDAPGLYRAGKGMRLMTLDVTSMYPMLMVTQKLAPRGLDARIFHRIVRDELIMRRVNAKAAGDKETATSLKVPVNSIFGKSAQSGSAIFDHKVGFQITASGQYVQCALTHMLWQAGAQPLSVNTDGVTLLVAEEKFKALMQVKARWEAATGLGLEVTEHQVYARLGVNQYLIQDLDGTVKTGGKEFSADPSHDQATSYRIAAIALQRAILDGVPIENTIHQGANIADFLHCTKVSNNAMVDGVEVGRFIRAYPSTDPTCPPILSGENKKGVRSRLQTTPHRFVPELPSQMPADLDYDFLISRAQKSLRKVMASVNTQGNARAATLVALGLSVRAERGDDVLSAEKSAGADYSTGNIRIDLGGRGHQMVTQSVLEALGGPDDVILWITRDGARTHALVAWDEARVKAAKARCAPDRKSERIEGHIVAARSMVVFGTDEDGQAVDFKLVGHVDVPALGIHQDAHSDNHGDDGLDDDGPVDLHEQYRNAREIPGAATNAIQDQAAATTNERFLRAMFGELAPYAWTTAFPIPPDMVDTTGRMDIPAHLRADRSGQCWFGRPYWMNAGALSNPGANTYSCISLFWPDYRGAQRRAKAAHYATYAIMLDDVGSKSADCRTAGFRHIHARIQTSAEGGRPNFQDFLFLDPPCTDPIQVEIVQDALVQSKLMAEPGKDPGMRGVTRIFRLPSGWNNKSTYSVKHPVTFITLDEGAPKYTIEEIAQILGVDISPSAPAYRKRWAAYGGGQAAADVQAHAVYRALAQGGMYRAPDVGGWHNIECPCEDQHTSGKGGSKVFLGANGDWAVHCHHGTHGKILPGHLVAAVRERTGIELLEPVQIRALNAMEGYNKVLAASASVGVVDMEGMVIDSRFMMAASGAVMRDWDDPSPGPEAANDFQHDRDEDVGADDGVQLPSGDALGGVGQPPVVEGGPRPIGARVYQPIGPQGIAPRDWLHGNTYIRKYLTVSFGAGGGGKSSQTLKDCIEMAIGRDLDTGEEYARGPLRVWYINVEDEDDEIARRIEAYLLHYEIIAQDLGDRLMFDTDRDGRYVVARQLRDQVQVNEMAIEAILREVQRHQIDVVILDPLVHAHEVNENDNGAMGRVAGLLRGIAERGNCGVHAVHHVRKSGSGEKGAEDGRGAVALSAAARAVRVFNGMSADEADRLGVDPDTAWRYIWVNEAGKRNLMPSADRKRWVQSISVGLGNGTALQEQDVLGVLVDWEPPAPEDTIDAAQLEAVMFAVRNANEKERGANYQSGQGWIGLLIGQVLDLDTAPKTPTRKRVNALIQAWSVEGGWLRRVSVYDSDQRKEREIFECD